MSSIPSSSYVYIGQWTNWSDGGRVLGSTITTKATTGAAVVAFIALFIQISGSHLWDLFCFFTYHLRARGGGQRHEAIYLQQQTLLRNNSSPLSASVAYLMLGWSWKGRSNHALLPNVLFAIVGIVFALAFVVAAIFSSFVVKSTDIEVLTSSSSCGYWTAYKPGDAVSVDDPRLMDQTQRWSQVMASSSTYSRACYNASQGSNSPQCRIYSSPRFHWTTDPEAACPFSPAICMGSNASAIQIDTGVQDVSHIFGINAPKKDRLHFRKVTTCAPLATDDRYVNNINISTVTGRPSYPGEQAVLFNYGPTTTTKQNSTWSFSSITLNRTRSYLKVGRNHYLNGEKYGDFAPRPELARSDADHAIIFISANSVLAAKPIDDPIFSAHIPIAAIGPSSNNTIYYRADKPAGVIGCIEQYQFCNPNAPEPLRRCTPLTGILEATALTRDINLNSFQSATMNKLLDAILNWGCGLVMAAFQPAGLLAERQVQGTVQLPIPRNQWQIEVEDWHGTIFAAIQQLMVEHTTRPSDVAWLKYVQSANTTAERDLCHAQKVRVGSNFSNINVFGLAFILTFGGIVILTNLALPHFIVWLLKRRPDSQRGTMIPWLQDGLLQIHRTAYQALGEGTWEGASDTVPVTRRGELLRNLWDLGQNGLPHTTQHTTNSPVGFGIVVGSDTKSTAGGDADQTND